MTQWLGRLTHSASVLPPDQPRITTLIGELHRSTPVVLGRGFVRGLLIVRSAGGAGGCRPGQLPVTLISCWNPALASIAGQHNGTSKIFSR